MRQLITLVICVLIISIGNAQERQVDVHYEKAYLEIKDMLEGNIEPSFKRAVFVTENAYMGGQLDYQKYLDQIDLLVYLSERVSKISELNYTEKDVADVRNKFAVYHVMKDSVPFSLPISEDSIAIFTTEPYTYDFEDFFGEKDWTKMFVNKLLQTHTGNCHSLPFLYKIIAEEIGTDAHLAMAPNHTYIKQWTNKTGWFNTELTSGQFPIDSWIMASGYIKLEAIQNRVFMDTLSYEQSLAVNLTDLAQGYQKKYGVESGYDFTLKCLDLALKYYPQYANALILKAETYKTKYEGLMKEQFVERPSDLWNDPAAKNLFDNMQAQYLHIYKLGYRQMPREMYLNWLIDIEEKDKDRTLERYAFEPPQPFKEYGEEVKITTLSKGKYPEFFDQDTTIQIGSVVFNRFTNQITHFVEYDTIYSEATLEPKVISRWLSPDPMAEEFYSWSPYNFVYNNPIRFTDPTGLFPIDYYDQKGNHIGTDGNDDGRVVVVTDKQEAKQIKKTNKKGGTTSLDQVSSGVELPSASVRSQMGKAVDRSNSPNESVGDTEGGFHEEGGIYGTTNGKDKVIDALPGPYKDPRQEGAAEVDVWSGETTSNYLENVEGTFHVHPKGEIVTRSGGANTIGGSVTTSNFDQDPSPRDYNNAKLSGRTGNNYVLGARNGTVTIYNNSGKLATFPLKEFRTIGVKD